MELPDLGERALRSLVTQKVWVEEEDFPLPHLYPAFRQLWHRTHFYHPLRFPAHPFAEVEDRTDDWPGEDGEPVLGSWRRTVQWKREGQPNVRRCWGCTCGARTGLSMLDYPSAFIHQKRMTLHPSVCLKLRDYMLAYNVYEYIIDEGVPSDWGLTREGVWALRLQRFHDVTWIFLENLNDVDLWVSLEEAAGPGRRDGWTLPGIQAGQPFRGLRHRRVV